MVSNISTIIGILCIIQQIFAIIVDDFVLERNHIEILVDELKGVSSVDQFVRQVYPEKNIFVDKAVRKSLLKYGFGKKWATKRSCIQVYYNSTIDEMREKEAGKCYESIRNYLKPVQLKIEEIISNAPRVIALLNKLSKCCRKLENHCDCETVPLEIKKFAREVEELVDAVKRNEQGDSFEEDYFVRLIENARACFENELSTAEGFSILRNQLENCIRNAA